MGEKLRFLITGGAGFIGHHLCKFIMKSNPSAEIVVVDSLDTGSRSHLGKDVRLINRPIQSLEPKDWSSILKSGDKVFHLAAQKHNTPQATPLTIIENNAIGTNNLLLACANSNVSRVVFTSSLYAYGNLGPKAMLETDTLKPTTHYGASKAYGEFLARTYEFNHDLEYSIARLFFIYGKKQFPGTGYKSVIVKNFQRAQKNQAMEICGDGKQSLDYVHVFDCVSALYQMAFHENAKNQIFNISSGKPTAIKDLISLMMDISRSNSKIDYLPADWTAGSSRFGDNEKIMRLLEWRPEIGLGDGLAEVWEEIHDQ